MSFIDYQFSAKTLYPLNSMHVTHSILIPSSIPIPFRLFCLVFSYFFQHPMNPIVFFEISRMYGYHIILHYIKKMCCCYTIIVIVLQQVIITSGKKLCIFVNRNHLFSPSVYHALQHDCDNVPLSHKNTENRNSENWTEDKINIKIGNQHNHNGIRETWTERKDQRTKKQAYRHHQHAFMKHSFLVCMSIYMYI